MVFQLVPHLLILHQHNNLLIDYVPGTKHKELMYYFVNGEYRSLDKDITEIVKGIVDLTDGVINENNYDSLFSIENIKSKIKMWGLQNEEKLSQMKLNEPSKRRNYTSAVSSIINEEKSVKRLIKNK